MSDPLILLLTAGGAFGCGLVGGIFFAFSTFVMRAFARLPADLGMTAMQAVNVTVLNPWFFTAFSGTAAISIALSAVAVASWGDPGAILWLAGALLYLAGVILVTVFCNVPLNDALAAADPPSQEGQELWQRYLTAWTLWNHVRSAAALVACVLFGVAGWMVAGA